MFAVGIESMKSRLNLVRRNAFLNGLFINCAVHVQKAAIALILLTGLPSPLVAAPHYIRADATGANNGSSWDDAWTNFSSVAWIRGDTYCLAGGSYVENVTISVAESGTNSVALVKANSGDNAADTDWNPIYATNQALVLGNLSINNSYVTIDGVTGANETNYGIKISEPTVISGNAIINFADGKSFLAISHLELQGPGFGYSTGASGFKQNTTSGFSKDLSFSYLYFHDLSQNGYCLVNVAGTSFSDPGVLFENNILENCGYNLAEQHGQGIQGGSGAGGSSNSFWIIRNSIFRNVVGTADIAFLGYSTNSDMQIYNNIFYNTNQSFTTSGVWTNWTSLMDASSPGVIYVSSTHGSSTRIQVVNNTFYNIDRDTIYFGDCVTNADIVANNLFLNGHFYLTQQGATCGNNDYYDCVPIISSGIYGVPYGEAGQQGENFPPCINAQNGNFNLLPNAHAIGNGTNFSSMFTTDYSGNQRPLFGAWDIGAFVGLPGPVAPTGLKVMSTNSP
jgi:hypothetical protein